MIYKVPFLSPFALIACLVGASPALAQPDVLEANLRVGWTMQNGNQMAAFHLTLLDGWKTYWRAPGDAGIPPYFDWAGSRNVKSVTFHWPRPEVFTLGGMQTIGYSHELILPVEVVPLDPSKPVELKAAVDLGVCSDICVPANFAVTALLPRPGVKDEAIGSALRQRPSTAREAGVASAHCTITPNAKGLTVTAVLQLPSAGGNEVVVVEPGVPGVWVSAADVTRSGRELRAVVDMIGPSGAPIALQRDAILVTVLGKHRAVEIAGCAAP
ncbi:protein-disulfide reductase DsbD domain-containing protein [Pseudorhodobacter ferrugineus]|uniref:protein-disulfide reductase DsbD domain-containing protein n=1 Tax=Pseudorhodobacter ferrugineus TaxID=77008 RepID=UPI0003B50401|nr:protein-disulfide reductase DsbD domain-containing protein [Pseudorhodobacter ferrugineus]